MTTKGKHLTIEDRNYIEDALYENYSLTVIAKHLGKDTTTISKEVRRNRVPFGKMGLTGLVGCRHQKNCNHQYLCSVKCGRQCKKCTTNKCYPLCTDYAPKVCTKLMKYPHVCNGCTRKPGCKLQKYRYRARTAHASYIETLQTSREGISSTQEDLQALDSLISPLIQNGQSIAHIYAHHKHEIGCSKRTLYTYFDQSLFTVRNVDLPRKVKYKPRKRKANDSGKLQAHRQNRTYEDFNNFLELYPEKHVVEMDTVHGTKGSKSLLTLFFRNSSLMLAFLLDSCTGEAIRSVFDRLYEVLGSDVFKKTFPVILTDNGSEFKAYERLEKDEQGNRRTHVFFCDPMASHQKGRIEKNHEYIRYILPKGVSFEDLTQEKVTLMMNHINSTARASLNDNTPFRLAQMLHDKRLLESCFLQLIPADDVHLKPTLLKRK